MALGISKTLIFILSVYNFFTRIILRNFAENFIEVMKKYYHLYTRGLEDDVIFRCDDDYVAGMNYIPIVLYGRDVMILAFTLMSNHFHFIVYSSEFEAQRFIEMYKRQLSRYICRKYGVTELLKGVRVGISEISDDLETLKRAIAYVLNNPVSAGINCFAMNYEWGSARCYFSSQSEVSVPLSSYSARAQRSLLHTCVKLPQSYEVTSRGYIDPRSYVHRECVERLFYKASSMQYHLNMSRKNNNLSRYSLVFTDELLVHAVAQMLEKQYGGLAVQELQPESLVSLVRDLNRRMNASAKQIARVLGVPVPEVVSILKSMGVS